MKNYHIVLAIDAINKRDSYTFEKYFYQIEPFDMKNKKIIKIFGILSKTMDSELYDKFFKILKEKQILEEFMANENLIFFDENISLEKLEKINKKISKYGIFIYYTDKQFSSVEENKSLIRACLNGDYYFHFTNSGYFEPKSLENLYYKLEQALKKIDINEVLKEDRKYFFNKIKSKKKQKR